MKKLLIISPYLQTLGGGEEHLFSIAQILEKEHNFHTDILTNDEQYLQKLETGLNISLQQATIITPGAFPWKSWQKYLLMRHYDILINVFDGSLFFPFAKKNYLFSLVPEKKLYQNKDLIFQAKLKQYYSISNSAFTSKIIDPFLPHKSTILPPFVQDELFLPPDQKKRSNIILMTGRFFPHLHSKRQDVAIRSFINFQQHTLFANFELHLLGRVMEEDRDYFSHIQSLAANNPAIKFFPNVDFPTLKKKYFEANYFWHFAGWGVDENITPQNTEHFGIAPLEGMASSNAVFCFASGGPKYNIKSGENGFLFENEQQLFNQMLSIVQNDIQLDRIKNDAFLFAKNNFSYPIFAKRVSEIFIH